jgi:hypothetical protein
MEQAVCIGSRIPRRALSLLATGAISPAAPGPPWMTATENGPLPYFLGLILAEFLISGFSFRVSHFGFLISGFSFLDGIAHLFICLFT